jgi:hypothetical protein
VPAFRLAAAAALAVALAAPFAAPAPARAAVSIKVALIVGPMGASQTQHNREHADQLAEEAEALGATVVKAYSPNATYAKVRAAVAGANIIVYWGHGSGYPNPYGSKLRADRSNGWGLNTKTTNGDKDSWANHTLVYCGEKALKGQLGPKAGADQKKYCSAGKINPAPGFVMVYVGSCYTAGGNEDGRPEASATLARSHVGYYSRPILGPILGGGGYFAGRSSSVVTDMLANPDKSFGDIYNENMPWGLDGAYDYAHLFHSGMREWLTHQEHDPYWYFAFAGNPARTLNGGTASYTSPSIP